MDPKNVTIYRSPFPDVDVPALSVVGLIDAVIAANPSLVACIDAQAGRSATYSELGAATENVAGALAARGLRRGGIVAIVAPNSVDWPIAALGIMRAGGAVTGANPASTVDELAHQFRDSGATAVITAPPLLDAVAAAAKKAECVRELFVFGEVPAAQKDGLAVSPFSELSQYDGPRATITLGLDDLCALPYSSGTTGRSKGVQLGHRTLVANICQVGPHAPFGKGERVLAFLPMFHIMGFAVVTLGGFAKGATLVTLPAFDPQLFLRAIQDHRVTTTFVVPPIANFLAAHPMVDQFDLSSLKTIGCGAAPLGGAIEEKLATRIGCKVAQGYGMTESAGVITYPRFSAPIVQGSSGVLLPNTEGMIVDPTTGASLPTGSTGELWFRGPQAFTGYLHNEDATRSTINAEGWVMTGDLGHFDEHGNVFITDRLKELIKVKGFQVAPAELEALLLTHPQIADVAVIGRPDERAGEVPVAFVVPRGDIDVEAVREWVAERVSEFKRLAAVTVIAAIPKTPSGKILRRVLRDS